MRILSTTIILPSGDSHWIRIGAIADALRRQGVEVDLVHYVMKGSRTHEMYRREQDSWRDDEQVHLVSGPQALLRHLRQVRGGTYDLVYGNNLAGTFIGVSRIWEKTPLIFDMHGVPEESLLQVPLRRSVYLHYSLMKLIERINIRIADRIVCVSQSMIEYLHTVKRVSREKMVYATNGVNLDEFAPPTSCAGERVREALGIDDMRVFGYIGAFQGWQGVPALIAAARALRTENVAVLLVGDGGGSREGNVISLPRVPRDRVAEYYAACDVLVLPRPRHLATEVAAPTKFAEYCAMGKPVLTTNVGDAAHLVRTYGNGVVVNDATPGDLLEGIARFSEMGESKLRHMGLNSRILAEKEFDWEKIGIQLAQELQECV